jgi:hypothetical protein
MTSLFQTAAGTWHIPSVILAISWLVTGVLTAASLYVNRGERVRAQQKDEILAGEVREARQKSAAAEKRAIDAEARQEREIERLKEYTKRPFSEEEWNVFLDALKKNDGRPHIKFAVREGDPTSLDVLRELTRALDEAGYPYSCTSLSGYTVGSVAGSRKGYSSITSVVSAALYEFSPKVLPVGITVNNNCWDSNASNAISSALAKANVPYSSRHIALDGLDHLLFGYIEQAPLPTYPTSTAPASAFSAVNISINMYTPMNLPDRASDIAVLIVGKISR